MLKRFIGLTAALTMIAAFSLNAATVTGKITIDSANGSALTGAKVVIGPRFGAGATDSMVTPAGGVYSFANVAVGAYTVTVSKAGYVTKAPNTTVIGAATADTVNVFLVAVVSGAIAGKVVSDSARGPALAGAEVVLSTVTGVGAPATIVDSTTSAANGSYSFATVADGNYTLAISKAGFTAKTTAATTVRGTATDTVPTVFLVAIPYGTIVGTVTSDSARGPALGGAKVVLATAGGITGGTRIDSMITFANGDYSFADVAAGTYVVTVSKTGYTSKTANTRVVGTAADTVPVVFLAPIQYGSVVGTITADSATGPAIAGAKVVLSTRGGVVVTAVDSMVTVAGGKYSFANVAAGNYSVAASATGYTARTVNTAVVGTLADTQNVALTTIQHGSLLIYVRKSVDSSNVVGASIAVTPAAGGTALSGMSGANGTATFAALATGNYTVSVTIPNYTAPAVNTTIRANLTDTLFVYMTASAQLTKTIKGIVTDSVGGAALANVQVTVRIAGNTGNAITIIDSTDATGAYAILGIPSATTTVALTATKTGYLNYTAAAVATANDTTTDNFKMRMIPVSVVAGLRNGTIMMPSVTLQAGVLIVAGVSRSAQLSIVALNGNLVYRGEVNAGTRAIALPSKALAKGSMLIAIVKQNGLVYRNTVVVP